MHYLCWSYLLDIFHFLKMAFQNPNALSCEKAIISVTLSYILYSSNAIIIHTYMFALFSLKRGAYVKALFEYKLSSCCFFITLSGFSNSASYISFQEFDFFFFISIASHLCIQLQYNFDFHAFFIAFSNGSTQNA